MINYEQPCILNGASFLIFFLCLMCDIEKGEMKMTLSLELKIRNKECRILYCTNIMWNHYNTNETMHT
jgi:hypothetical protein